MKVAFFQFATAILIGAQASQASKLRVSNAALQQQSTMEIGIDLTKTEVACIKGKPSTHQICSYFPVGEFFLQKRESINTANLPIDVANIEPGSLPATKLAHFQRLKQDLPDASTFGADISYYGLQGPSTKPILSKADKIMVEAARQAEEKARKELELEQMKQREAWFQAQFPKATLNVVGDEAIVQVEETVYDAQPMISSSPSFATVPVQTLPQHISMEQTKKKHHHSSKSPKDKEDETRKVVSDEVKRVLDAERANLKKEMDLAAKLQKEATDKAQQIKDEKAKEKHEAHKLKKEQKLAHKQLVQQEKQKEQQKQKELEAVKEAEKKKQADEAEKKKEADEAKAKEDVASKELITAKAKELEAARTLELAKAKEIEKAQELQKAEDKKAADKKVQLQPVVAELQVEGDVSASAEKLEPGYQKVFITIPQEVMASSQPQQANTTPTLAPKQDSTTAQAVQAVQNMGSLIHNMNQEHKNDQYQVSIEKSAQTNQGTPVTHINGKQVVHKPYDHKSYIQNIQNTVNNMETAINSVNSNLTNSALQLAQTQIEQVQQSAGQHDDQIVEVSCYDTLQAPAIQIELGKGKEATILIRKPNKGVNVSSQQVSTLWIETVLDHNTADKVYKLTFEGKFYKSATEGWTTDHSKSTGDWPYYGWTITANEEHRGLGAFMLESALLTCPSEQLRYNEYEDKAYRIVVKVVD